MNDSSSSSDEETKRVVKSEKNKRWESLREVLAKMAQHQKNQDYAEIEEGEMLNSTENPQKCVCTHEMRRDASLNE